MSLANTTLWADLVFKVICAKAAPLCSVPLATGSQGSKAPQLPEPLLSDNADGHTPCRCNSQKTGQNIFNEQEKKKSLNEASFEGLEAILRPCSSSENSFLYENKNTEITYTS